MSAENNSESLKDEMTHILEECRMVLPGIQALIGFQLVAVFNERFSSGLSTTQQIQHLVSILLSTLAVIFVLAPAAYHRQIEPHNVSDTLVRRSTRFLMIGMSALMVGLSVDLALIAGLILKDQIAGICIAAGIFLSFLYLWFIFPWQCASHKGSK